MIVVVAVALHRVWEIGILLAFSRRFLSWPADAVFPAPHQVAVVVDRSRHSLAASDDGESAHATHSRIQHAVTEKNPMLISPIITAFLGI